MKVKFVGRFIICAIFILLPIHFELPKVKAAEPIKVGPPCWLPSGINYDTLNKNRAHSNTTGYLNGGKAVDFGAGSEPNPPGFSGISMPLQKCVNNDVIASIDGVFHINATNRAYILRSDGLSVWYEHIQLMTKTEGQLVKTGDIIGKTSVAFGYNHIHFDVRRSPFTDADKLTYNQSKPDTGEPFNTFPTQWEFSGDLLPPNKEIIGDFNGDGKDDKAEIVNDYGASDVYVYLSYGKYFIKQKWFDNEYRYNNEKWYAAKIQNGNQDQLIKVGPKYQQEDKTDIKVFNYNGIAETPAFTKSVWYSAEDRSDSEQWIIGDFDGSGLTDLARIARDTTQVNPREDIFVYLSSGSEISGFQKEQWHDNEYWAEGEIWYAGNFSKGPKISAELNSDPENKFNDLVKVTGDLDTPTTKTDIKVFSSNGTLAAGGFNKKVWFDNEDKIAEEKWVSGDFNGDGLKDIARIAKDLSNPNPYSDIFIFSSQGTEEDGGMIRQPMFDNEYRYDSEKWYAVKVKEGNSDQLVKVGPKYQQEDKTDIKVFINNSTNTLLNKQVWYSSEDQTAKERWFAGDFSGDGLYDLEREYVVNNVTKRNNFTAIPVDDAVNFPNQNGKYELKTQLEVVDVIPAVSSTAELISAFEKANLASGPIAVILNPNTVFEFSNANSGLNALPILTGHIFLEGNGSTISRSGTNLLRAIEIATSGNLIIWNTEFINFDTGSTAGQDGGVFMNKGGLTFLDSEATNNHAYVGGVFYSNGNLHIENAMLKNNSATKNAGVIRAYGSTVVIKASNFNNNSATALDSNGGVIQTDTSSKLTVTSSGFYQNSAAYGGVIYTNSPTTITNSSFNENSGTLKGGAIRSYGVTLDITTSQFTKNISDNGGAINVNGTTNLDSVTFTENNSRVDGGGLYLEAGTTNISASTFRGNYTGLSTNKGNVGLGGAIRNFSTASISSTSFIDNTAYIGGAIYNNSPLTLYSFVLIQANKAINSGGGIRSYKTDLTTYGTAFINNQAPSGSSIINQDGNVNLYSSCFENNSGISVVQQGTISTLKAEGNWWNSSLGANSTGADKTSNTPTNNYVDSTPYLTTRYASCMTAVQ